MSERLDVLLVKSGLASSRTQAQRLITAGAVRVEQLGHWVVADKPASKFPANVALDVREDVTQQYVSRAGQKLVAGIDQLRALVADFELSGKLALDIGQSTGGFTDCLLQYGIQGVVGIDVGHDQLAAGLKNHPKVIYYEGVNARTLPVEMLLTHAPSGFDLVVMDVSFISQTLILPGIPAVLRDGGYLISLVKPQFEVGRSGIGKGGLVKDPSLYGVVEEKIRQCLQELSLVVMDYLPSPIAGADGNREFLVIATR